jgi:4-amino-4-deoxy-L-arabinose transferase-like glycosyltransferase
MDPLIGLLVLTVAVFSSCPLIRKLFRDEDTSTVFVISFIFGSSSILLPLLFVGIFFDHGFVVVSWGILLVSGTIFLIHVAKFLQKLPDHFGKLKDILRNMSRSPLTYAFIATILFFAFKYICVLSIKGIFDWDVINLYLPFARRIYMVDHIPPVSFDYVPVVIPQGISVLYAWSYCIGGSPFDESFRLFPLLFEFMIMLLIYRIAADLGSKQIAKIAVIVYALMPLHDAILFYCSYYPDLFYNALILSTFFFMYRYVRKCKIRYCLFGGLSLGLSALMKPQFFVLLPATIFVFLIFLKNSKIQLILTYAFSALVGLFFVSFVWTDNSFLSNLPITTSILALAFIFSMTTIVAASINGARVTYTPAIASKRIVRDASLFYGIFGVIVSIWYLRNYFLTGSVLWSVGFHIPNYQWALDFVRSVTTSIPEGNIESFLTLLVLLPFAIYVLGTIWIVPKLVGLIHCVRKRGYLMIIIWTVGYWIGYFWWNFHNFGVYATNPRDLFLFAPFFSILMAFGIAMIAHFVAKKHSNALIIYLISSLGFTSLIQSMLISEYGPVFLQNSFAFLAESLGCSLRTLSGGIPSYQSLSSIPNLLLFISIVNLMIFAPIFLKFGINSTRRLAIAKSKLNIPFKGFFKNAIIFALMFSILVAPYLWLTYEFSGGNMQSFGEAQLKPLYGGLFTEVASYLEGDAKDGDAILVTDIAFTGLQYYIRRNVKVIALNAPGNLAAFRNIIECSNSSMISNSLYELGVHYFLEPTGESPFMKKLSRESLLPSVLHDLRYFMLARSFPGWNLYKSTEGGSLIVKAWEDESFSENWTYSEQYSTTGANWSFTSDGNVLTVVVAGNAKASFRYFEIPPINTTEYPYLVARVRGSINAR